MKMLGANSIRYGLGSFMAMYRVPISALLGAMSALALGFSLQTAFMLSSHWRGVFLFAYVLFSTLLLVVSIIPQHYERVQFAEALLPIVHDVLKLDKTARITIHHIRNRRGQTYDQLVDYFPTRVGRGRTFVFTQGITGQAFRTRRSHAYSIPDNTQIEVDYQTRWAFTEDEIARLSKDRRSFYAYPVGEVGGYAKVVIYFDSADSATFNAEAKERFDRIMKALFQPILERLLGVGPTVAST